MIYNVRKTVTALLMVIFGSIFLYNCEPEADTLGEQLFLDGAAQGKEISYDMFAFNINNNDQIRSDAARIGLGTLGAFNEPQFGLQKSAYVSQIRMSSYDPDFGTNAIVDSAVLVLKPVFETSADSIKTTTDENYIYPDGNVAAKKVVSTSPVKKYGKGKINVAVPTFTIKVEEVSAFLNSTADSVLSNKDIAVSNLLAEKTFKGNVSSVAITKDSDNSAIFTSINDFRINLNPTFFQTKIIAKKGQPELKEVANFIRYFRGLKLSVNESDGYLFQINPNDMEIIMYYKNDKFENGNNVRPQSTFRFSLGAGNSHIGLYQYTRTNEFLTYVNQTQNTQDAKIFLQGMGGPSMGLKFPAATVDQLKTQFANKSAVISAKIRIYTDASWNNSYKKPSVLTMTESEKVGLETKNRFTADFTDYTGVVPGFAYLKAFDLDKNPAYYEFTVTKSVKRMIEEQQSFGDKFFKIDIGDFLRDPNGNLAGVNLNSRAYVLERMVVVGTGGAAATNPNRVQLKVIYGTKIIKKTQ